MSNQLTSLRMDEHFKKTPAGSVPLDWTVVQLAEVAQQSDERFEPIPGDVRPYIGLEHIGSGTGRLLSVGKSEAVSSLKTIFRKDDILFGKLRPALRKVAMVGFEGVCSTDILVIRSTGDVSGRYLYYCLRATKATEFAIQTSGGTKMPRTSWRAFKNYKFPCPPRVEQDRISEILNVVGSAIETSQLTLDGLRNLREGLLQTFFPKYSGRKNLPKGWKVIPLGEVATLQRGVDLPIQSRRVGSVPVYGSNGVLGVHAETEFQGPGVITGRSGTIGKVFFCEGPYWPLNTTLHVIDFHQNNPRFVALLLTFLRLERYAASTGVPSLNRNFIHPLQVAVPPIGDQNKLVEIIEFLDAQLSAEASTLNAHEALFESLMQGLLTGKIRTRS